MMKGKMRINCLIGLAAGIAALAVVFFFPFGTGRITANAAEQLTVADALANIYQDQSSVVISEYKGAVSTKMRDSSLKDILAGKYSPNAVAVFLDHGYYKSSFAKIKEAGVLPESYKLPEKAYHVTRTAEVLPETEKTIPPIDRHVLVTNSPYLQNYQLLQIARVHGFDEIDSYVELLQGYEDSYLPKYISDTKAAELFRLDDEEMNASETDQDEESEPAEEITENEEETSAEEVENELQTETETAESLTEIDEEAEES